MLTKAIITIVLVLSFFLLPFQGFTSIADGNITAHLMHPLSHANIFHLAANISFLWLLKCHINIITTFVCAALCSFLPTFTSEPTAGFSGVLFAAVAISWGRLALFKRMLVKNKWFLIIPFFLPHVNALFHIYCLLAGYLCGYLQRYVAAQSVRWGAYSRHKPSPSCEKK